MTDNDIEFLKENFSDSRRPYFLYVQLFLNLIPFIVNELGSVDFIPPYNFYLPVQRLLVIFIYQKRLNCSSFMKYINYDRHMFELRFSLRFQYINTVLQYDRRLNSSEITLRESRFPSLRQKSTYIYTRVTHELYKMNPEKYDFFRKSSFRCYIKGVYRIVLLKRKKFGKIDSLGSLFYLSEVIQNFFTDRKF